MNQLASPPLRHGAPPAVPLGTPSGTGLRTRWARHMDEVRAAQRLRHQVFADEMGATVPRLASTPAGHDEDGFDRHCEHLLVIAPDDEMGPGKVIGTYRVLTPTAARAAGGLYGDTEFDLSAIDSLRPNLVELGRSCVDAQWRSGAVILALWAALGEFMNRHGLQTMVGCASVGVQDGGHAAASLWSSLQAKHMADAQWQVAPRLALPLDRLRCDLQVDAPPLIKGYLRCGARLLGAPAWDQHFKTADLPLMNHLPDLPARYRRHFLGD